MPLTYIRSERVSLRHATPFNEMWLHDRVAEDTSILGLGNLEVIARERVQAAGGRLDMILSDPENNVRYEVELMLGATDPSHIIRCIEYWDIERRRFPAYDHVAVLIAEEVTSRFLNVMALLAGSIPLIAIQLNVLKIGDGIVLDFVKVLDQRDLRTDDTAESDGDDVDRSTWENRVGNEMLGVCDRVAEKLSELVQEPLSLRYKKKHIGFTSNGVSRNIVGLFPRRSWVRMRIAISDSDQWQQRLEEAGLESNLVQGGARLAVTLTPGDMQRQDKLLHDLLEQAVKEYRA